MREHTKLVVWPRPPQAGPEGPVYRYVVVGMVVSDQPIPEFEGRNEILLDGPSNGVLTSLSAVMEKTISHRVGDANSILTRLEDL